MPNTKFKPILIISILFFLLIFLSAFANQPASPSPRFPTSTPTSIYAIPRWQPPDVEPLPMTTPDAPADQYTLANWTADTAQLTLANYRIDTDFPREQPNAYLTLLEEANLRFSKLARDESFLLELATIRDMTAFPEMNPRLSNTLPSLPIYTKLLEDELNRKEILIEDAEEWIRKNMTGITIESIHSNNIFGDQADVWAFNIIKFDGNLQTILLVSQTKDGTYRVRIFSNDDWEYPYRRNFELKIQDLNGNGIPEIIMERLHWYHYGIEDLFKDINIYEWNGNFFVSYLHEAPAIHFFTSESEETLNVWTYDIQPDGSTLIIGKQTSLTIEGCPVYIEYFYYRWTGHSFELDHIDVEPLPENTGESCKVIWSLAAGQQNPDTIQIISKALSNWPEDLENAFGPAAQDYLALWMAEAAALQGDKELARSTLDNLIQNPYNPHYSAISGMAQVYKKMYLNKGPYQACYAQSQWRMHENFKINNYRTDFSEEIIQLRLENWGFKDPYYLSAYPCSLQETFESQIKYQSFLTKSNLIRWLYLNELRWNGLRQMDMNNDGKNDWIVVTNLPNQNSIQSWAILQLQDQNLTIKLLDSYENIENLDISVNQYFPSDHGNPVQIYRMGTQVVVFQVIDLDGQTYPFIQFTAGTTENPTRGVEIKDDILTIYFKNGMSQYQWHDQHQRFELLQSSADEPESPSLEELLFVEQNPQAVIDELEPWFKSINPATEDSWESYFIENTLPYRTYLLGLAYELNGEEQKAVETYYDLWQTYPESPFTIIARYKLEKME
jgi:hypothetical protein